MLGQFRCQNCHAVRMAAKACPMCHRPYAEVGGDASPATDLPDGSPQVWLARFEIWQIRVIPPLVVVVAMLAVQVPLLAALIRTFFAMIVHESGHAIAAWLVGRPALPTLWVTYTSSQRSWWLSVAWLALAAWGARRALQARKLWQVAGWVALLLAHLGLSFGLKGRAVDAWITFGGAGGAMVLGMILVATFYLPSTHYVVRQHLRWGFLWIGACAWAIHTSEWLHAARDHQLIPYAEIEGVGLSDAAALLERCNWSERMLLRRHLGVAIASGMAWLALHVWAVLTASRREVDLAADDA